MLARSLLALLCGVLATVAAHPQHNEPNHVCEDNSDSGFIEVLREPNTQWVAKEPESERPGIPIELPAPGRPPKLPHYPHKRPDVSNKTIYQALKDDEKFSRLFKLVSFAEDITATLNDSSSSVTFFAPPDRALRPPKRHGKHGHKHSDFDAQNIQAFFTNAVIENTDELELFATLERIVDNALLVDDNDNDDDEEKERKKKIIKRIVTAVLEYHILPAQLHAADLAKNATFPTSLTLHEGSLDSQPLRLRVEQPVFIHPLLKLNFYASVLFSDVQAKNGLIHVLDHPLFPPPSSFQILFTFSDVFSTLTSAIQRVDLKDAIDWHWVRSSKTLEGSPAVTIFAPTNAAFLRLPKKLKFFLFSPFGTRALKKLLSLHVIPEYVLHSNWVHNASDEAALDRIRAGWTVPEDPHAWTQAGCHDEDFDFLADSDLEEFEFDRRKIALGVQIHQQPARPEADGYGFLSGEYRSAPPCPCQNSVSMTESGRAEARVSLCGAQRDSATQSLRPPIFKPVYTWNGTLPTLLTNHSLDVRVAQFRSILPHGYVTKVFINGQWVTTADVPARNGAIHIIKHLIKPRGKGKPGKHHGQHFDGVFWVDEFAGSVDDGVDHEWDDWEEWLPEWANEVEG